MRPCSLFLSLLMLLWHCCTWCSNETLLEMLMWWQWVFVLNSWVSWCFCDTVAPDVQMSLCWKCWFEGNKSLFLNLSLLSLLWLCCTWCWNETLLEMLIWRQWVFVLNSWFSWCFCDSVAPDAQMRLCWKCWCEGNEYLFLIPESLDAFVTLLHLMFKWATVSQKHQETQELRTNTHCHHINISNKVSFEHQVQQCHKSIKRLRN